MREALGGNPPAFERFKQDAPLRGFIKRTYEHSVACGDAGCCCDLGYFYHDTLNGGSPEAALSLYTEAELGYCTLIDDGLTYYGRQLEQAIEGQQAARTGRASNAWTSSRSRLMQERTIRSSCLKA